MASASLSVDLEEDVTCPICLGRMTDPVSVDCGHNFCRRCITNYCETRQGLKVLECPLCQAKMKKENFRSNWPLANIVEKLKGFAYQVPCERHNETLNLFCKEDVAFVCAHCERSPEHRSHTVLPLEDAADEYKNQFSRSLETLEKERLKRALYELASVLVAQKSCERIKAARDKTVAELRQLRQFLEEEETRLLAHWKEVEAEAEVRRGVKKAIRSLELSSLDSLIKELEEKQQQSAYELLKDVGSTLQKCEKRTPFGKLGSFPPMLKWRNCGIEDIHPFVEGVVKQFKDTLESGFLSEKGHNPEDANRTENGKESVALQLKGRKKRRSGKKWRSKRRPLQHPKGDASMEMAAG